MISLLVQSPHGEGVAAATRRENPLGLSIPRIARRAVDIIDEPAAQAPPVAAPFSLRAYYVLLPTCLGLGLIGFVISTYF